VIEAALCTAWRVPITEVRSMLTYSSYTEEDIWGALLTIPAIARWLQNVAGEADSAPVVQNIPLRNGNVLEISKAGNASQLMAQGGLSDMSADVIEMLRSDFNQIDFSNTVPAKAREVRNV
jgi:hypothetical protein